MQFDTGFSDYRTKSAVVDDTQDVRFTNWTRADRMKRQIIEQIESLEYSEEVDSYISDESLMIDALYLFDPVMADEIADCAESHKAILKFGGVESAANPRPAAPDIPKPQHGQDDKENPMLDFDTGNQGSQGPWIAWSARGTQDGEIPPKTFMLRDENGKKAIDAFGKGVVMDIYAMKTGWQKSDGIVGQAPDWKWNASVSKMEPQPGEDYKKGFSIPCAIGGGQTATWEQAGAACWGAFTDLVPALQQAPEGKLPVVQMTDTKLQQFKRGSTVQPILSVVKWVDRPDCLKEGVQAGVDTGDATPAPAQEQTQQQAAPAPATADADVEF